jgi:hypothetical protein
VKQALEKREAIVAKEIQEIEENDKAGKEEPKIDPWKVRLAS